MTLIEIENWGDTFTRSLQGAWYGVVDFVPTLVIALVIFAIGWIFASLVERLIESIFKGLKVDSALKGAGIEEVVKRSGHNLDSGAFLGAFVKWFIIIVFLMASFEVLGLEQVNYFLRDVVTYLPEVIVAVLILMVALIVGNVMHRIVVASSRAAHIKSAEFLGSVTKWAIWIFAILTALYNLGIGAGLIQNIVTAVFAGIALAIGLAFGLGGRDVAQKLVEDIDKSIRSRN